MLGAVKKLLQHQQSSKSIVDAKLHIILIVVSLGERSLEL